jgi:hypothetical protein
MLVCQAMFGASQQRSEQHRLFPKQSDYDAAKLYRHSHARVEPIMKVESGLLPPPWCCQQARSQAIGVEFLLSPDELCA